MIFLDPILHFFGASPATLPYARDFMQVILMGNPIAFTFIGLNNVMRATGYPKKAMLSSLLTVFANIILAPIFIFHLDWGIRGSSIGHGDLPVDRFNLDRESLSEQEHDDTF